MAKPSPKYAGTPSLTAIGQAIRASRQAQGYSQEELALAADLDRSYVGGIERGEHNLTVLNFLKISNVLGMAGFELLMQANV